MTDKSREDQKLYAWIAAQLRTKIEDGEFLPGEKLPPLSALASAFGCSRATVREAVGALRGQGLVELRHGDGTYVRTASVEVWMEPLDAAILLGQSQVTHLVEVATAILAGIASSAAERSREEGDLADLMRALFRLECAEPKGEDSVTAELDFYMALGALTRNPLYENTLHVLQEALRSVFRVVREDSDSRLFWVDSCRMLFDAVKSGDAQRGRETVYRYGALLDARLSDVRRYGVSRRDGRVDEPVQN